MILVHMKSLENKRQHLVDLLSAETQANVVLVLRERAPRQWLSVLDESERRHAKRVCALRADVDTETMEHALRQAGVQLIGDEDFAVLAGQARKIWSL